ncbi:Gll3079 protein [Candidatus Moduliflexus flocculans]|uniref:Gll3079 protein n=1 Tax=Candidatus Moduliflexus flocculans TaxID=1499966 RepID=A0A0S6W4Z5_9BACT|nr:Gll3079 protein [Candidatus Moduliflexus flocculans]
MGDGMTHLFHIILGLVNARGGILLIDEFENGLHHEIHQQIWELIFDLATQLNVQVFATTHSNDTIEALERAASLKKYEENIKLIKLKSVPKTGRIKPVELDSRSLKSLIEQDIEVR